MSVYDIDFPLLVRQLLPVRLRNDKTTRWLQCLVAPVVELYGLFTANRLRNVYNLAHNSQVTYLQAVLNDVFDPVARGVYIDDGGVIDPLFVYLSSENEPMWLGLTSEAGITTYPDPEYLYTGAETLASLVCFVVKVPFGVVFDEVRLRALVDKYRLPSKGNYSVVVV